MKLFIWQSVEKVSSNWHDGGGLAVVAPDLAMARGLIIEQVSKECGAIKEAPDAEFNIKGKAEPQVWVFPDSGCC